MGTAEKKVGINVDEITIARMSEHDLLEVVEIEEQSGLSRWGWAAYYAELQGTNKDLMLIAVTLRSPIIEHQRIAGYIVARQTAGELHINNVAVREQYRRRGIGSALLESILEQSKRLGIHTAFLEVRSGNKAAQALYEKCGFKAIARRSNYYSEPREDAVVMSLILKQLPA
jgi:[ribosomal protein S18]-alanine N-acetyltransferase